ncbi:MAG: hypothetical protein LUC88_04720 [Prevotella sp.]|nr:hypothetical protein [Prevotella sp.]
MVELLTTYNLTDILIFCVILALALKAFVTFLDWAHERMKQHFDKGYSQTRKEEKSDEKLVAIEKEMKSVEGCITEITHSIAESNEKIDDLVESVNKRVDTLVESDIEAIKSYITEKHRYFVYEQGWIDAYSKECLIKRFQIYKDEGGNTFVGGLMDEICDLPMVPPKDDESMHDKFVNTEKYIQKNHEKKKETREPSAV